MTTIDTPEFRELLAAYADGEWNTEAELIAHIDAKIAEAVKEAHHKGRIHEMAVQLDLEDDEL